MQFPLLSLLFSSPAGLPIRHAIALATVLLGGAIAAWLLSWGANCLATDARQADLKLPRVVYAGLRMIGVGAIAGATALTALSYFPPSVPLWAAVPLALAEVALSVAVSNLAGTMGIVSAAIFQVGDVVRLGGYSGRVRRVGALYTHLETQRHGRRRIPNHTVLTRGVAFAEVAASELRLPVFLAYTVEPDMALAVIREAAMRTRGLVTTSLPDCRLVEHGAEAIRYELSADVAEREPEAAVVSRFHVHLLAVLNENGLGTAVLGSAGPTLPYGLPVFAG